MGSSPTLHTHSPSCSLHVLTCTGFTPARGTFPRLSGVGEGILLAACWGPCPHVVWGEGHSLPSPLRDSAQPHPSLSEAADEQGWGSPLLGMMLQARPLVCSWKPEAGFSPGKSLVPRGGGGVGGVRLRLRAHWDWKTAHRVQAVCSGPYSQFSETPGPTGLLSQQSPES